MASDDGARILIDGASVIEHDGLHGASLRKAKTQLKEGQHTIRVEYFAYGNPNSFPRVMERPWFPRRSVIRCSSANSNKPIDVDAKTAQAIKAMQVGYTAILCSPDFLYLRERGGQLNNFEIASRLSYFLWSSMPDDQLFDLAKASKLTDVTGFAEAGRSHARRSKVGRVHVAISLSDGYGSTSLPRVRRN